MSTRPDLHQTIPIQHHPHDALAPLRLGVSWGTSDDPFPRMPRDVAYLHHREAARRLLALRLAGAAERSLPPMPAPRTVAATGSVPIGAAGAATFTGFKLTFNVDSPWGEGAAGHIRGGTGIYMTLGPNRRKEADIVRGLEVGSLVAFTESSKAPGGAKIVGFAGYHGCEEDLDGTVYVSCAPVARFAVPLPSSADQRPFALRAPGTGFGMSFSAQPILAPFTPTDLAALRDVLDLPTEVLVAEGEARLDALQRWGRSLDETEVHLRWRSAALAVGGSKRVTLGGLSALSGRAAELFVRTLLERLFPDATVHDVSQDGGLGYDLEVRVGGRVILRVEVKSTRHGLTDPARWVRGPGRLRESQRRAAERSMHRGAVPWVAAVVTRTLDQPNVVFVPAGMALDRVAGPARQEAA
jgi:hypothetical protein